MFLPRTALTVCLYMLLSVHTLPALAQEAARGTPPGRWPLETLRLHDGTEYRGLILAERDSEIDFAEIIQPAGKPMYAVIRGVERQQAAELKRLAAPQHKQLEERFRMFRNRALIEAGRMEEVELTTQERSGTSCRVYDGEWFELLSTTDDESTRKCVVRIEQIFRAYRTLLPPRVARENQRGQKLQVHLYGSMADYRARLRQLGLSINNPACYAPKQRLILAGGELTAFAERLNQTRRESETLRKEYARLDVEFSKGLNRLSGDLKESGFTADEVTSELRLRKTGWKTEMEAALSKTAEIERRNAARFREVTKQMFARLNHEAFHAYLDLYVYPHDRQHVPRWLNEGLAQVFEYAQLEGDTLRIDAPDRTRLAALQADRAALPLARLLTTSDNEFLANEFGGSSAGANVQRTYLYSWAVAHYLAFQEYRLTGKPLDDYVAGPSAPDESLARFEKLVEMPLADFERGFRQTMLGLKP